MGPPRQDASGLALCHFITSNPYSLLLPTPLAPTFANSLGQTSTPDLALVTDVFPGSTKRAVVDHLGSDHFGSLITATIPNTTPLHRPRQPPTRPTRHLRKANWPLFTQQLEDKLSSLPAPVDATVEELTARLQVAMHSAAQLNNAIPCARRPLFCMGLNQACRQAVLDRRRTLSRFLRTRLAPDKIAMKRARAKARLLINTQRSERWQSLCSTVPPEKAWRLVRAMAKRSNPLNPPLQGPQHTATDDASKAALLNRHYAQRSKYIPPTTTRAHRHTQAQAKISYQQASKAAKSDDPAFTLFNRPFTMAELDQALHNTPTHKASGIDQLPPDYFHHLGPQAKSLLLAIINLSWTTGHIPPSWKQGVVIAIPKPGKPQHLPSSYRPITLLNLIPKIAERMAYARALHFAETQHSFTPVQAGFRRGYRITDQLLRLTESVEQGFQTKQNTLAVFFDIQQAFDTVWLEGLLQKLLTFGITGRLYLWIRAYLLDRTICTRVNGVTSRFLNTRNGVPQGSILGPFLWLVYVNDLPKAFAAPLQVALFADDLAIWTTSPSHAILQRLITHAISRFLNWCARWKLIPSLPKTLALLFSLQRTQTLASNPITLSTQGQDIPILDSAKYLGLLLDPKLSWKPHLDLLVHKAGYRTKILRRLTGRSWGLSRHHLKTFYAAFIRPLLEFGSDLWGANLSKAQARRLDKIQNINLRLIERATRDAPIAAMEVDSNIPPLHLRREKAMVLLRERAIRCPSPHPLSDLSITLPPPKRLKRHSPLTVTNPTTSSLDIHPSPHGWGPSPFSPPIISPLPPRSTSPLDLHQPLITIATDIPYYQSNLPPFAKKLLADNILNLYPPHRWSIIYTDGSVDPRLQRSGAGAAIYTPEHSVHLSLPLGPYSCAMDAEVQAITAALQHPSVAATDCNIVLFTDSKSSLMALHHLLTTTTRRPTLLHELILTAEALQLHSPERQLQFHWIPAHVGIPGNELADRLASAGSKMPPPFPPIPYEAIQREEKAQLYQKWTVWWAQSPVADLYHICAPPPGTSSIQLVDKLPPLNATRIVQLRLNRYSTAAYKHRLKLLPSPDCLTCRTPDTVNHLLRSCSRFSAQRHHVWPSGTPPLQQLLFGSLQDLQLTTDFLSLIQH